MPMTETTTTNRGWLVKMLLMMVVLLGFGIWGLMDAVWVYPARGRENISYRLKVYLEACQMISGRLGNSSIADPTAKLAELSAREAELRKAQESAAKLAGSSGDKTAEAEIRRLAPTLIDAACYEWLTALSRINQLTPEQTRIAAPEATLTDLIAQWKSKDPPKPLDSYDLPLQYGFCAIGLLGALYFIVLIVRVKMTRFGWDPAEKRLYLPSGKELVPGDIAEIDKRKWHKFYVSLRLHEGGAPIQLDLLRFDGLEGWVLEMERTAFPELAGEQDDAAAEGDSGESEPAQNSPEIK